MTVFNLGSINADFFYHVPHIPFPGETIAASKFSKGLGGKGANMSVAIARAGGHAVHIGAVGNDGRWAVDRLSGFGVDVGHIEEADQPTGHAVITLDAEGENAIIILPGANRAITQQAIRSALSDASNRDILLMQNETNNQVFSARLGSEIGLRVAYAAAPFDASATAAVLPYLDLLVLNEIEAEQLVEATATLLEDFPITDIVVTLGAKGCRWINTRRGSDLNFAAKAVSPIDTTGAGDTFTGFLLAALDRGQPMEQAIDLATKAGAVMVTRLGTADVIPSIQEVRSAFPE